jgi:hypothetical protein
MFNQNWRNISYLQKGSSRQRAAFIAIRELQVLEELKDFDPITVGTIPIGVDIPQSDIDIACHTTNLRKFETILRQKFGSRDAFNTKRKEVRGKESVIARFNYRQFSFEIFGQDCPTEQQDSFRHMVVEYRILQLSNEHTRLKIKRLRNTGKKTEPAFAEVLQLKDDAYEALLKLADQDDQKLMVILRSAGLV